MKYLKRFFIVLGLYFLSIIYLVIYGVLKGLLISDGNWRVNLGVLTLVITIIFNVGVVFYFANLLGFIHLDNRFITKKNLILVLIGFVLLRAVAYVGYIILFNQGLNATANDQIAWKTFSEGIPLINIFMVGFVIPIMEEVIFRAAIINYWLKDLPIVGIAVSALIFGAFHSPTNVTSYFIYTLMGVVLAILYYKSQRIEVSIGVHILNNLLPAISIALM